MNNVPNSFQHPNWHVDDAAHLLTSDEFKILTFLVRHTLGWQHERLSRQRNISLSMFQDGFTTSDGHPYHGTGLGISTITKCLRSLVEFGFILKVEDDATNGTKWELPATPKIQWDKLQARQAEKTSQSQRQTRKARAAMDARRSVTQDTQAFCVTEPKPFVSQNPSLLCHSENQTHTNPPNPPSLPPPANAASGGDTEKPKKIKKPRPKDPLFEAILKGSYGLIYNPDSGVDEKTAGRVNGAAKVLRSQGITHQQLEAFYEDYPRWRPDLDVTRDGVKLAADVRLWLSERGEVFDESDSRWTDVHRAYAETMGIGRGEWAKLIKVSPEVLLTALAEHYRAGRLDKSCSYYERIASYVKRVEEL